MPKKARSDCRERTKSSADERKTYSCKIENMDTLVNTQSVILLILLISNPSPCVRLRSFLFTKVTKLGNGKYIGEKRKSVQSTDLYRGLEKGPLVYSSTPRKVEHSSTPETDRKSEREREGKNPGSKHWRRMSKTAGERKRFCFVGGTSNRNRFSLFLPRVATQKHTFSISGNGETVLIRIRAVARSYISGTHFRACSGRDKGKDI